MTDTQTGAAGGGTRIYLFVRPTPAMSVADLNWKNILNTLNQHGVQVMEDCSGAPVGQDHLILNALVKDYGRVPTIVNAFRKDYGLSVSIYPWESPSAFTSTLNKTFAGIEESAASSGTRS